MMTEPKWINFKDKLPKNGTFTVQRRTPETPKGEYTYGSFHFDPGNSGFAEYRKVAQWKQDL